MDSMDILEDKIVDKKYPQLPPDSPHLYQPNYTLVFTNPHKDLYGYTQNSQHL